MKTFHLKGKINFMEKWVLYLLRRLGSMTFAQSFFLVTSPRCLWWWRSIIRDSNQPFPIPSSRGRAGNPIKQPHDGIYHFGQFPAVALPFTPAFFLVKEIIVSQFFFYHTFALPLYHYENSLETQGHHHFYLMKNVMSLSFTGRPREGAGNGWFEWHINLHSDTHFPPSS